MTRFAFDDTQSGNFLLPIDDSTGQLTGLNTEHTYIVPMDSGEWSYTVTATSAKSSGKGMLRFKIKRGGKAVEKRQDISPDATLSGTFCVTTDNQELKFIFSRKIGTTGVRYTCQISGPTSTEACPLGVAPERLPYSWWW